LHVNALRATYVALANVPYCQLFCQEIDIHPNDAVRQLGQRLLHET
jgi:hypothetical protein